MSRRYKRSRGPPEPKRSRISGRTQLHSHKYFSLPRANPPGSIGRDCRQLKHQLLRFCCKKGESQLPGFIDFLVDSGGECRPFFRVSEGPRIWIEKRRATERLPLRCSGVAPRCCRQAPPGDQPLARMLFQRPNAPTDKNAIKVQAGMDNPRNSQSMLAHSPEPEKISFNASASGKLSIM